MDLPVNDIQRIIIHKDTQIIKIKKLLDRKIVKCKNGAARTELIELRMAVNQILGNGEI